MPESFTFRPATAADWPAIRALLATHHLPIAGAEAHLAGFIVAESGDKIAGCIGMECHGRSALLRSAVVAESFRDRGVGRQLVAQVLAFALGQDVTDVALLTTTAELYFARLGFRAVPRNELESALGASAELRGACPASAVAMRRSLPDPFPVKS